MRVLEAFTQGQDIVYKNLLILLTLFLILAFGTYISYILSREKNYPIYIADNVFDSFLSESKINNPVSSTVINNVTVSEVNSLVKASEISYCPVNKCVVNLSTGVKRCPVTIEKTNTKVTGLTYTLGEEFCVDANKCPPTLPFAIRSNGEALTNTCDIGENCYCTSTKRCATSVVKIFKSINKTIPNSIISNEKNYSFVTTGTKENNNIMNSILLPEDNTSNLEFCKLNPAYTDRIIDGCNFTNKLNQPSGCEFTNYLDIAEDTVSNFTVVNKLDGDLIFGNVPDYELFGVTYGCSVGNQNLYLEYTGTNSDNVEQINNLLENQRVFQIGNFGTSYYFSSYEIILPYVNLKNIYYYNNGNFVSGLKDALQPTTANTINVIFENIVTKNCIGGTNDNSNFKNMLTCLQPYNQPCTDGVLAYNVDTFNSRNFCQATSIDLTLGNGTSIRNFYLNNPSYFTLSCVIGMGCNDMIDTSLCTNGDDCGNAFSDKISKLFPQVDYSAITNNFIVQSENFKLDYIPYISTNNTNTLTINNNFIKLENGDFFLSAENFRNITLRLNGVSGSNILNVNSSLGISKDDSISISQNFTVSNIIGTSVYLNKNLNVTDSLLAKAGYELLFYSNSSQFLSIGNVSSFSNKQTFEAFSVTGDKSNPVSPSSFIENDSLQFYKLFGFNGLGYNTRYDYQTKSRVYSSDYYYNQFRNDNSNISLPEISYPFTIYEFLNITKQAGLLEKNANFKQAYSLYYPVFNQDNFKQECVYCSPSLLTDLYINKNGNISGINIQFSGQDYYQYNPGNFNNLDSYYHTTFGLTALNKPGVKSNTNVINLNEPVEGLEIGDYIIDQQGFLEKSLIPVIDFDGIPFTGSVKAPPTNYDLNNQIDDKYLPYRLNGRTFLANGGNSFKIVPGSEDFDNSENVYFGKIYLDGDKEYYIRPEIKIVAISSDRKTIVTDSNILREIKEKQILQFIKSTEILKLGVLSNIGSDFESGGSGGSFTVESITNGRIVSISIIEGGKGYSSEKKPLLYVDKYFPDNSIFSISN